jgi:hypothetical protein
MFNIGPTFLAVLGAIVTLAAIAVVVSKNAQTSSVLTGAGSALSGVIAAAVAPVSGSTSFGSPGVNAAGATH